MQPALPDVPDPVPDRRTPNGPPAFMPFETFAALVDQIPTMTELQLQGLGEPMMHPRFFEMVALCCRARHPGEHQLEPDAPHAGSRGAAGPERLTRLQGSIDGATPETYERIRVRSNWHKVIANLEGLVATKRRMIATAACLDVVVVMRQNLNELADLVRLAARSASSPCSCSTSATTSARSLPAHYRPMHDFVADQTLVGEDQPRRPVLRGARAAAARIGVDLRLPEPKPRPHLPGHAGPRPLRLALARRVLQLRGPAMPCCMVATPDRINFGNAAQDGVIPIWGGRCSTRSSEHSWTLTLRRTSVDRAPSTTGPSDGKWDAAHCDPAGAQARRPPVHGTSLPGAAGGVSVGRDPADRPALGGRVCTAVRRVPGRTVRAARLPGVPGKQPFDARAFTVSCVRSSSGGRTSCSKCTGAASLPIRWRCCWAAR